MGLQAANARFRPELRPAFLQPSLCISLRNTHSEQGWGSGPPGGSGPTCGLLSRPVRTQRFDHLCSALRLPPRSRPEGTPPSQLLGLCCAPGVFAEAGAGLSHTWVALDQGASLSAAKRTFPGAAVAWAPTENLYK